jgi:hypothetical protein
MKMGARLVVWLVLPALLLSVPGFFAHRGAAAQGITENLGLPIQRGQNIQPVFEGWEKNADGTFSMWFGYLNRNFVEEPNVPVGLDNTMEPGGPDRGQPTHFYRRRMQFVFNVHVPADWGKKDLVWTITAHGKTDKAYGTLLPQWEVDKQMMVKNLNGQDDLNRVNGDTAPTLQVDPVKAVTLPGTATLSAVVTDPDGIPKELAPTGGGRAARAGGGGGRGGRGPIMRNAPTFPAVPQPLRQGLSLGWIHYRGPGKVTFNPPNFVRVVGGEKITRSASFSEPGTYVLRAIASDSWLFTMSDVTVTVTGQTATK